MCTAFAATKAVLSATLLYVLQRSQSQRREIALALKKYQLHITYIIQIVNNRTINIEEHDELPPTALEMTRYPGVIGYIKHFSNLLHLGSNAECQS